ncbi:hypothetical protein CJ223_02115 [Lactobacillus iners]|nr:hypothetical protein CJ223_02115 [Lactobacillus iners]
MSSLIFLITNETFSNEAELESAEAKRIRKKSLKEYIDKNIQQFANKKSILLEQNLNQNISLEDEIASLNKKFNQINDSISSATKEREIIVNEIINIDSRISETEYLLSRNQKLMTQYISDVKSIDFISEIDDEESKDENICPFCNNKFCYKQKSFNIVKASQSELNLLFAQIKDLKTTINQLSAQLEMLKKEKQEKSTNKIKLQEEIYRYLTPQANSLKNKIETYKNYIQIQNELTLITNLVNKFNTYLTNLENEQTREDRYHPKEKFPSSWFNNMSNIIYNILSYCNYPNLTSVRLSPKSMDIEINGESKASQGKGFRSFLNTILILSIRDYFYSHAIHKIKPFIIDTPLLGLDEEKSIIDSREAMSKRLFNYCIDNKDKSQLIIIENIDSIPNIDYNHTEINHINFT